MPAIPASTRNSITLRLLAHAEQHWPQLRRVEVTYRGVFAYVSGVLRDGEQIPLCRLRYGGSARSLGFAIYSAVRGRYQNAALLNGLASGSPRDALDTACTVDLAGIGGGPAQGTPKSADQPPPRPRGQPADLTGYLDPVIPP